MRRRSSVVIIAGLLAGSISMHGADHAEIERAGVVDTYCAGCHNGSMRSPSGALLDQFDAARIKRKAGCMGASLSPASGRHDAASWRAASVTARRMTRC